MKSEDPDQLIYQKPADLYLHHFQKKVQGSEIISGKNIILCILKGEMPFKLHTKKKNSRKKYVCLPFLFDLILYVPSTIFQLNRDGSSWVDPVLS